METDKSEWKLHNRILESCGMAVVNRMYRRGFTGNIFSMNALELDKAIETIEDLDISLPLWFAKNREEQVQTHREINRLFHNFLASAKTLVDHTRIFMETYYARSALEKRYAERLQKTLADDELCAFVHDLRNYMLHYGLPYTQMHLSFENDGNGGQHSSAGVSLDKKRLREWSGWKGKSKRFLDNQGDAVGVRQITASYTAKIKEFNDWLDQEIKLHHATDLEELHALQKEYQTRYPRAKSEDS
ncbi:MAG: hypothetical protein PHX43_09685 [Alphaproteobacteria bacterium]|nr:hypothetical protein [Alphaproteobacteria bacterium]